MVKTAVIGLGKMGISHLAILNAHPDTSVDAVCDASGFIVGCMEKVSDFTFYPDYKKMLAECDIDAVLISTPTSSHAEIVSACLERGLHVFVEKPFCLNPADGLAMASLAQNKGVVNQVGYHNKFVASFQYVKTLLEGNLLGELYFIRGEAYGPVVLKPKGSTWRSKKAEGGGCLHDYASHVLDLMNYYVGKPVRVGGTALKKIYSKDVEDAVYSTLFYDENLDGQLSINWSEPTYRKMSTMITLQGTLGKIIVDRQECRIFLHKDNKKAGLDAGWTIKYTTELTPPVGFYLRGEEYSAQMDYFVNCIKGRDKPGLNSFASALDTDKVVEMLSIDADKG